MVSPTDLDEKRVAIVLNRDGETVVLTGLGVSTIDPMLGSVLRVELDEEHHSTDDPVFIIPAANIEKLVNRRSLNGCDYCITFE